MSNKYCGKVSKCFLRVRESGKFSNLTDDKLKIYLKALIEKHERQVTFPQLIEEGYPKAVTSFSSRMLEVLDGEVYSEIMRIIKS